MIIGVIVQVLWVLEILLFVYFILSWFPLSPGGIMSQIYAMLDRLFSPILNSIRRVVPPIGGTFDVAGLILIFGVMILQNILRAYA